MNPLGVRALYLGSSMYRIHGTDAPWTIGTAVSKGCIRMYNQDVLDLYPRVNVGTKVTVTWDQSSPPRHLASQPRQLSEPGGQPRRWQAERLFDLFGDDDDEPVQKAPPKRTRSKSAKSASVE